MAGGGGGEFLRSPAIAKTTSASVIMAASMKRNNFALLNIIDPVLSPTL